jgi:lysophospholipid acyltransferase (LPLAT)-like uncharacterized protein
MDKEAATPMPAGGVPTRARKPRLTRSLWRRLRVWLVESDTAKHAIARVIAGAVRFVSRTNPPVAGSHEMGPAIEAYTPAIVALWHGQHIMAPAINPGGNGIVALFSRSADAELNALVAQKLGFGVVRGSGGRESTRGVDKGGARALIALKKTLDGGKSVAMIADIPHGTPREAGLGIVTLAKVSGRPIVPIAVATSRRKVLEKSWDKTTINLPFGRRALVIGEPVLVPGDAGPEMLEQKRRDVTRSLSAATDEAYALVDGAR